MFAVILMKFIFRLKTVTFIIFLLNYQQLTERDWQSVNNDRLLYFASSFISITTLEPFVLPLMSFPQLFYSTNIFTMTVS